jgi:ligand-binding sensor domain-containing protein
MFKFLAIIFLFLPIYFFGQVKNIGTPNIQNYPKSVYQAGTQNWGISQDQNGFMYFANNDGVLRYDGVHWELIEVSNNSPVRSVFVDDSNNIYVGLFNDFGVITQLGPERPTFKSLKHLLPSDLGDFDDVWRIHEIPEGIVFQCYKYLFLYQNDNIEIIKTQSSFHFSFQLDDRLFLHEPDLGVFELINGKQTKLPYWEEHKEKDISAILETENNQILICTAGNGIYKFENEKIEKWDTPVNDFIERNRLYCATAIPGNYFAFGTILNGLVISDSKGNIVQKIDQKKGLQNNTILSVFVGKDRNLWLGLDNGIDYVEINSPISFIRNTEDLGTGYCCIVYNSKLYLGTNQGLFVKPFNKESNNQSFELVENSAGQVWSLDVFDGQLICGHDLGTFIVKEKKATQISDINGAWKYIRLKNNPAYLLGGHYAGLVLLKNGKSGWEFHKKVKGFSESSRYIKQSEDGNIWISHGGKGIFQVALNEKADSVKDFILYTSKDGLPSSTDNILFEFKNRLYVSTTNQIYEFNKSSDSFQVSEEINQLFNFDGRIKTLVSDSSGNIWYIGDNESGVLRQNEDLTYTKITTPFRKLNNEFVNEFEFIYPLNNENIFVGIDDGFAHYTSKFPKSYSQSFQSFITKIDLPYIDSVLYINNSESKLEFKLPFKKNTFRFNYAAPFFNNKIPLEFSYYLDNYSENWSEWSVDSYKDFSNLPEEEYLFSLKAKNVYGVESEISTFQFTIAPPWHRSVLANYLYVFFFLIINLFIVRFILYRIKLSKEKEKLRHKHELLKKEELFQHQAVVAEKEIIRLRNDKLRAEKLHRDKELANQTMSLIQKNKLLNKLSEELQRIQNLTSDASSITKMVLIRKNIKKELDNEEQNKLFKTYFEDVHADFFKHLKEKYPKLTPGDLKLCAYIKMDISTKEISTLLNISYRGVEISRYRLRKKMELSRDINLSTFLSNI